MSGYTFQSVRDRLPAEVVVALDRGQSVIPMNAEKKPLVFWKELQERQPTPDELSYWLFSFGRRIKGWARITGRMSGVVVFDFDGTAVALVDLWGLRPHLRTGSGGYHLILRHPGWKVRTVNSKSSKRHGAIYPGVDVRGDGGYSMIAGFNAKGGYTWLRDPEPDPLDVLPRAPREFFGLLEPPRPRAIPARSEAPRAWSDGDRPSVVLLVGRAVEEARVSGRNNGGLWLALQLRDNGYSQAEAESAGSDYVARLWDRNTKGDVEPYELEDYRKTVAGVYAQAAREPWSRRARVGDQLPPLVRPVGIALPPLVRPNGVELPPLVRPGGE